MTSDVTAGNYVMVAVTDSGYGIPAAILDKVFEPFFTTKDVGKGSGLGLSMVYGFVKQSNGHVMIYSEEGHGTTVRIYLPQAEGVAQPVEASRPSPGRKEATRPSWSSKTIVWCENWLSGNQEPGYVALTAASAAEALIEIDSPREIDLLFTDMIMPGTMNGRQLAEKALQRRASLKILFTSGYSNAAIIHDGHLDAGVLLLAKRYRKSDLAQMIRTALTA